MLSQSVPCIAGRHQRWPADLGEHPQLRAAGPGDRERRHCRPPVTPVVLPQPGVLQSGCGRQAAAAEVKFQAGWPCVPGMLEQQNKYAG